MPCSARTRVGLGGGLPARGGRVAHGGAEPGGGVCGFGDGGLGRGKPADGQAEGQQGDQGDGTDRGLHARRSTPLATPLEPRGAAGLWRSRGHLLEGGHGRLVDRQLRSGDE